MAGHAVHTIRLRLPAATYTEAVQRQTQGKHWVQHTLVPLLSHHLDSLTGTDEVILIERIELALAGLPWELTEAEWRDKLAAAVQPQRTSRNSQQGLLSQWLFYLAYGCFQTSAFIKSARELEAYLLRYKEIFTAADWQVPHPPLSVAFLQRLILQANRPLAEWWLHRWLGLPLTTAPALYGALRQAVQTAPAKALAWCEAVGAATRLGDLQNLASLVAFLPGGANRLPEPLEAGHTQQPAPPHLPLEGGELPRHTLACAHAGLVLLLPFLARYLEHCGLVEDKRFADAATQATAVRALHYLTAGTAEEGEEALLLPKLLCGVQPGDFVLAEVPLPENIQMEGEALLQSVIEHWVALKQTSVQGLREAFLQRRGQLTVCTETYTLQVEESGVDILLNSLPWGFRHFRLPWMQATLITEWY